jgi:hypothetical protein
VYQTGGSSIDCCKDPDQCDDDQDLDAVLAQTGCLKYEPDYSVNAADITGEVTGVTVAITNDHPVCLRIGWHHDNAGGHFIAVATVGRGQDGRDYFGLSDPKYESSSYAVQDLIAGNYLHNADYDGKWTHRFFTEG